MSCDEVQKINLLLLKKASVSDIQVAKAFVHTLTCKICQQHLKGEKSKMDMGSQPGREDKPDDFKNQV